MTSKSPVLDESRDAKENMSSTPFFRWRRRPVATKDEIRDEAPQVRSGSAAEALHSMFGDEELSDIRLKGSDGGTVPACKALLAARSSVFRSRFYSTMALREDIMSSNGKPIQEFKDWDCRILHLVVEFCYTDTLSIMKVEPSDDIARIMAGLNTASKVFKLPGLQAKVKQWSWRNVNRHPALACAMIDEGMKLDDIEEAALQIIHLKSRASLLPEDGAVGAGILSLAKPGLLLVLRTLEDTTSHLLLFQSIQRWVDFAPEDSVYPDDGRDHSTVVSREKSSREAFARKCAMRFIKLSKINPGSLEGIMQHSSMFSSDKSVAMSTESSILYESGIQFSQ